MVSSLYVSVTIIKSSYEEIMYLQKTKYKFWKLQQYDSGKNKLRQGKLRQQTAAACHYLQLLLAERLAVGALICSGIDFVGAHQDLVQGTVVLVTAVMGALLNSALNALVCMTVHNKSLL